MLVIVIVAFRGNYSDAQSKCVINSVEFPQAQNKPDAISKGTIDNDHINLKIKSSGCENGIKLILKSKSKNDEAQSHEVINIPQKIHPDKSGLVYLKFNTDEGSCMGDNEKIWGYDCVNYFKIFDNNDKTVYPIKNHPILYKSTEEQQDAIKKTTANTLRKNGILVSNCNFTGCGKDKWEYEALFNGTPACEPLNISLIKTYNKDYFIIVTSTKSVNNSCRNKNNIINIIGKNKTNTLSFNFPDLFRKNKSFKTSKVAEGYFPVTNFCDKYGDCSFLINYELESSITSFNPNYNGFYKYYHDDDLFSIKLPNSNNEYIFKCSVGELNNEFPVCDEGNIRFVVDSKIEIKEENTEYEYKQNKEKCRVDEVTWKNTKKDKKWKTNLTEGVAILTVKLQDCNGQYLNLRIQRIKNSKLEEESGRVDIKNIPNNIHYFVPPDDGIYEIKFKTHGEECSVDNNKYDCRFGVIVDNDEDDNKHLFATPPLKVEPKLVLRKPLIEEEGISFEEKYNLKNGLFYAECESKSSCGGKDWEIIGDNSLIKDSNLLSVDTIKPAYSGKCLKNSNNPSEGYNDDCYELLAPIPGVGDKDGVISKLKDYKLGNYINQLFQIALGILMVLAVIMIVAAGVQYMTVESFYAKGDAKKKITGALGGLILALGIVVILNTINPRLLKINFGGDTIKKASLILAELDTSFPSPKLTEERVAAINTLSKSLGIYCPYSGGQEEIPKIVKSFEGNTTYRLGGKYFNLAIEKPGEYTGKDTGKSCPHTESLCLDCSGFTNMVLQCAGVVKKHVGKNSGTSGTFGVTNTKTITDKDVDIEKNTVKGEVLEIGDLIGQTGGNFGHILIYIGDGKFADSTSNSRNINKMIRIIDLKNLNIKKINKFLKFSDISE